MAYLFLDTRFRGQMSLWWEVDEREEVWAQNCDAADILRQIQLHRAKFAQELKGVGILPGPGRFSALRVGIVYAHMLAKWYKIPLYRLFPADIASIESRKAVQIAIQNGERQPETYIAPEYDREPNITKPTV